MCIDICIIVDVMFYHNEDKWNNIFEKKCEYKTFNNLQKVWGRNQQSIK